MSGFELIQYRERMAQLSLAYVHTIASHLGYGADSPRVDHDSVDLTLSSSAGRKAKLDIQLKSTSTIDENDLIKNEFSYTLPIKNYDDLRAETICPRILVVLCMPKNKEDWIEHSSERLLIRKCAYWISLQGQKETTNKETITVKIPTKNIFSPESLKNIMDLIDQGESLKND